MENNIDFMVRVNCMTYNQASYIEDTMNGFCMQQTKFPFLCHIADDASTDGEPEVIRRYLDVNFDRIEIGLSTKDETDDYLRIFARHKENKNCYFCVILLKYNHSSIGKAKLTNIAEVLKSIKYVAFCEGDDYWTDPMKLQKQVDFLEKNPDFSLCFHKVKVFDQKEGVLVDDFITRDVPSETDICELAKGNYIHTPAVVYRKNDNLGSFMSKLGNVVVRDYPMWMGLAQYGKIKKFEESMAVYRVGVGVWSGDKNYVKKNIIWLNMLCKLFVAIEDKNAKIILEEQIEKCRVSLNQSFNNQVDSIRNSYAYRLGNFILRPVYFIKKMFNHKKKVI